MTFSKTKADTKEPVTVQEKNLTSQEDDRIVPSEIVRCTNVEIVQEAKNLTMSNANGDYSLSCNPKAAGCITPEPGKNDLLFN